MELVEFVKPFADKSFYRNQLKRINKLLSSLLHIRRAKYGSEQLIEIEKAFGEIFNFGQFWISKNGVKMNQVIVEKKANTM